MHKSNNSNRVKLTFRWENSKLGKYIDHPDCSKSIVNLVCKFKADGKINKKYCKYIFDLHKHTST